MNTAAAGGEISRLNSEVWGGGAWWSAIYAIGYQDLLLLLGAIMQRKNGSGDRTCFAKTKLKVS